MQALTPIVYDELHRLARHYMRRERPGHSLQATALVNEAYMRLVDYTRMQWQDRAHFFAVSAQVDAPHPGGACAAPQRQARRAACRTSRSTRRRRGSRRAAGTDLVALDDALIALARIDPRKAQIVEMRFFGGLTVEETAEVLKVSPVTVKRDWRAAKAWLYRELTGGRRDGRGTLETR